MELLGKFEGRGIYFSQGHLDELNLAEQSLPMPHFVCAFFLHETNWLVNDLKGIVRYLIDHGAVYFLFHGNRCEQAHQTADEGYYETTLASNMTRENIVLTASRSTDTEGVFIFDALCTTWPAHDYESSFSSYLMISIGTAEDNNRIRELLQNLDSTLRNATGN